MPSKVRDFKHEWELQQKREKKDGGKVLKDRLERQNLRRKLDREGVNRKGKDVAHVKALSRGGSNKDGYFLSDPKENQSFARRSDHKPKALYDRPPRKKK